MSRSLQNPQLPTMAMPEPIQVTEPSGYDVSGYRTGGFVAPPSQQIPPKTVIPSIREPQFPEPQASAQVPPTFKSEGCTRSNAF